MFFSFIRELGYVYSGTITGKSAVSLTLWSLGALLLIAILAITVLVESPRWKNVHIGISLYGAGILFLTSCFFQYGLTLAGPAGYCIPLGIPVIWIVGLLIHLGYFDEDEGEMPDDDEGEDEGEDEDD